MHVVHQPCLIRTRLTVQGQPRPRTGHLGGSCRSCGCNGQRCGNGPRGGRVLPSAVSVYWYSGDSVGRESSRVRTWERARLPPMHVFKRGTREEGARGTWWFPWAREVDAQGRETGAFVGRWPDWLLAEACCPECGHGCSISKRVHSVAKDGTLDPSWVCPHTGPGMGPEGAGGRGCTFHVMARLEGWPGYAL